MNRTIVTRRSFLTATATALTAGAVPCEAGPLARADSGPPRDPATGVRTDTNEVLLKIARTVDSWHAYDMGENSNVDEETILGWMARENRGRQLIDMAGLVIGKTFWLPDPVRVASPKATDWRREIAAAAGDVASWAIANEIRMDVGAIEDRETDPTAGQWLQARGGWVMLDSLVLLNYCIRTVNRARERGAEYIGGCDDGGSVRAPVPREEWPAWFLSCAGGFVGEFGIIRHRWEELPGRRALDSLDLPVVTIEPERLQDMAELVAEFIGQHGRNTFINWPEVAFTVTADLGSYGQVVLTKGDARGENQTLASCGAVGRSQGSDVLVGFQASGVAPAALGGRS
jgi:hypothetical protein